jgi:hypothetical protein
MQKSNKEYSFIYVVTNIFKTFFSEPKPFGYVSIHKKEGNIYK